MHWELRIDPDVIKELRRLPKKDAARLLMVMQTLPLNPYTGDIKKMQGEVDAWRRRVGAYRIFYDLRKEQEMIYVFDLQRRTSNTY